MTVRLYEWDKNETGWAWIEITDNKVVNLLLRSLNNLIKINEDDEAYVDLQLDDWIDTSDTLPVWVLTWRVLQADWRLATGTLLVAKTTSWDEIRFLFADNWKLYTDNWTGTFKQIYLKPEVDALFQQLRGEISAVGFSGDYNDLLNKPTLWTASSKDVWTNAWNVPILDSNWMLDPSIVPSVWVMNTFTVTNKSDLTTLTTAVKWDIGIVTSENKTYILSNDPYSTLSNWSELLFPTWAVSSVNWFTWAVVLTTWFIQESSDNLFVSTLEKATWNNKLWANNVSTVALTGNYNDLNNKPTIDSTLDTTSTHAIQNWAVATAINTINTDITNLQTAVGWWIDNTAYWSSWDGDTTHAPTKDAVYDEVHSIEWDISTLQTNVTNLWTWKQDTLVSGTNIKTINNQSLLWSWNITIEWGWWGWSTYIYDGGYWIDVVQGSSDYSAMRWPCAEGYHVPTSDEMNKMLQILNSSLGLSVSYVTMETYLKMPRVGMRDCSSADIYDKGEQWFYWTSSPDNDTWSYALYFNYYTIEVSGYSRANGMPIRPFKNESVNPISSWTTLKSWWTWLYHIGTFWYWIAYNSTDWLISLSWDGQTWITISDKNLWATTVYNSWDTLSVSNCWWYYQWWNNYMFSFSWNVTLSYTKVDASTYWPWNYYNSSTFIASANPYIWDTSNNWNLWWWTTWVITNNGTISVDADTIKSISISTGTFWWFINACKANWSQHTIGVSSGSSPLDYTYTFTWCWYFWIRSFRGASAQTAVVINDVFIIDEHTGSGGYSVKEYVWPFTMWPWDKVRFYCGGYQSSGNISATIYDYY